jgi:hypothetical protein
MHPYSFGLRKKWPLVAWLARNACHMTTAVRSGRRLPNRQFVASDVAPTSVRNSISPEATS